MNCLSESQMEDDLSDLDDDDELESLLDIAVNRQIQKTITRHRLPLQQDLTGKVIEGQQRYYEEIKTTVSYGPTQHILNYDNIKTYIYPTNYEIRDYQFSIVQRALLENVLCAIPTGMGKTFIASTVMLNYYRWSHTAKIIFTAPTRPLVAQQIKACLGMMNIPHTDTAILLDKSRKHREKIWAEKRVFFTTPQVVENDLKRGVLNPKDIILLVIDEAHRARGSYAYVELVKFIDRFNTSYRLLALTATPATDLDGVQEVVDNLHISTIEIRTENSIDILKYMKRRKKEKIQVPLSTDIEELIEQLGIAILPTLKEAIQLGIYDNCEPTQINAFIAMQQSQRIISNPSIPEGVKWRNYFILQLLSSVGHMIRRLKVYGIRPFFSYFTNKHKEFTTKYGLGKSTNKVAASFYCSPILGNILSKYQRILSNSDYLGHEKLKFVKDELMRFFKNSKMDSRAIIFTELRESALEIVKCIDGINSSSIRPHIFIGQSKGKEGFDDEEYHMKYGHKGRTKGDRLKHQEREKLLQQTKKQRKDEEKYQRSISRTGSSEDAQINGMSQKQQKEVISNFQTGKYNVLVCTSIGEEGLDIGEVDLIICYDTTSSPIKNIQRMGRTGRKRDGKIVLLLSGNESLKFDQAMEDYSQLQHLISHNSLNYKLSDRIIPINITPLCIKQFIDICKENIKINTLETTEEVIKFATQAMLGKLKIDKEKRKSPNEGTSKKFFMPDNVETGIVSAINLVNRYTIDNTRTNGILPNSLLKKRITTSDNQNSILDEIEYDSDDASSLESFGSPNINLNPDPTLKSSPKKLKDILQKSYCDFGVTLNNKDSKLKRNYTQSNIDETFKKVKLPVTDFENDIESSSTYRKGKIYKNIFKRNDGLLTVKERKYFDENYFPLHIVSWDAIPSLNNRKTKAFVIPHSKKIESVLKVFLNLKEERKETIIEMNRTIALARRVHLKHNSIVDINMKDIIVSNHFERRQDNSSYLGSTITSTYDDLELQRLVEDDEGLSDFLDSDK